MNMDQIINGVKLVKQCSIKPEKDSKQSKTVNLEVKFDNTTLGAVFGKAMSSAVIQWQNGPGRKLFDTWKNGQTITIEFKAPGRAPSIPLEQAMASKMATMSPAEREKYIADLIAKAEKM